MEAVKDQSLICHDGFINNEWVRADSTFSVFNPANGNILGQVSDLGALHTTQAIDAASYSLRNSWGDSDPTFRADKLFALADAIYNHIVDLSLIETLEQGKPLAESRQEWQNSAQMIVTVAKQSQSVKERIVSSSDGLIHHTHQKPIGVVAAITPWNFPVASVVNKCAAALAAGCTVVLKPSELTPFSALAFARLIESVDFPPGVINVIPTLRPDAVGEQLMRDSRVRMLTFTGSVGVGKQLAASAAGTVKRVELELGGNAPFIVLADGESVQETDDLLDRAASALIKARFYNAGQICVGANRIFVEERALNAFLEKLIPKISAIRIGPGIEPDSECGPLINESAIRKIESLIFDAVKNGAHCIHGGERVSTQGCFFKPTVLTGVTAEMAIAKTEIFGPVVAIQTFTEIEEVITAANSSQAGLSAYLFSSDSERCATLPQRLEAGMVGCNTSNIFDPRLAFGGIKESGYGREGGAHALDPFLIEQNISYQT